MRRLRRFWYLATRKHAWVNPVGEQWGVFNWTCWEEFVYDCQQWGLWTATRNLAVFLLDLPVAASEE